MTEASSGEAALRLVGSQEFDLIFIDQYMSSCKRQLLGTEAVRELRARGVKKTVICGLSANDVEAAFIEAGSDFFQLKPIPCEKEALTAVLQPMISLAHHWCEES